MKFLKPLLFGTVLTCSTLTLEGLGISAGPFSLQFEGVEVRGEWNDPICTAIHNRSRLEMVVESRESISSNEFKAITKKLTVEPYAFYITQSGKPVLRGNVVEEKLLREVTVKVGDEQGEEKSTSKKKGFFSGLFKGDKSQDIDFRKVSDLVVLNSHFDAPKGYKPVDEDGVEVLCEIGD